MTRDKLEKRITELETQRDQLVEAANRQIHELNGAIMAYKEMLAEIDEPQPEPDGTVVNEVK